MTNDPNGNIYIAGGHYYDNNVSKRNNYSSQYNATVVQKLTVKGKKIGLLLVVQPTK